MAGSSHEVQPSSAKESKVKGPIVLPSHQLPERFYKGGPRISTFRGEASKSNREPEDWVASTTCCAGHDTLGLTRLPTTDTLLVDEIRNDTAAWLGAEHVAKYGADTKLLIKLLDAGQRLPIHAHPHVDWARAHVKRNHGKAEAWHILAPGRVYLGLKQTVSAERMLELVDQQEIETMLAMMYEVDVEAGDTVYVPPGLLHAIGEGILLVEVQEPEDMSILLEWRDFELDGQADGHLGLGFEKAMTAVTVDGLSQEQVSQLVVRSKDRSSTNLLPTEALEYFRMDKIDSNATVEPSFQLAVVLQGQVEARVPGSSPTVLRAGTTTLFRHADGPVSFTIASDVQSSLVLIRPPQ